MSVSARVTRISPSGRVNLCVFMGSGSTRGITDIGVEQRTSIGENESWTIGLWRRR